jgi:hypothetical protein
MMAANSEEVALNVMPLVFSVRDDLLNAEGFELLAAEWHLEGAAGSELLPEELVIAGSKASGINTHLCVLSWERGVVDPFKIDRHIKGLSKKIGDIEQAVEANELGYEEDGLLVLRRFSDRFNRVLFVDMMDRRFKGSWDSVQVKQEGSEAYLRSRFGLSEDFTSMPPCIRVLDRQNIEFLPSGPFLELGSESLSRMVSTPLGIDTISRRLPELGCSILREMNAYAYSAEELDVARSLVGALTVRLGKETVTYPEFGMVLQSVTETIGDMNGILSSFNTVLEGHITSGKVMTVSDHIDAIGSELAGQPDDVSSSELAKGLLQELEKSLLRSFPEENEVRAWQMRSSIRYFLTYCRRVNSYFETELKRYLVTGAATEAFMSTLEGFREDLGVKTYDEIDTLLFSKFFAELVSQLRAIFDREAFESGKSGGYSEVADTLGRNLMEAFEQIEIWRLVSFGDLAKIARTEIADEYADSTSEDSLNQEGRRLIQLLESLELIISETLPSFVQYVSSTPFMAEFLRRSSQSDGPSKTRLMDIISQAEGKSGEWAQEGARWVDAFSAEHSSSSASHFLADFLTFVHKRFTAGISAASMVERVASEHKALELELQDQLSSWEEECERIEAQNAPIIERNRKRLELITQAKSDFQKEQVDYHEKSEEYERRKNLDSEGTLSDLEPPVAPEPLDSRIERIERDYPEGIPKALPERPVPSVNLMDHRGLREILSDRLERMDERLEAMCETFSKRLEQLNLEGTDRINEVQLDISDGFVNYLLDSMIRSLGKLMPRIQRVLLRNPDAPSRIHLVTYDYAENELIVTVGLKEVA